MRPCGPRPRGAGGRDLDFSQMPQPPLLSVVVPTRNEAESIPVLVDRVLGALPGVDLEICVVDDSDDETPRVLLELADRHGGAVRPLLRQGAERRGGLSTAVIAGLRMSRGRYVCVMDADLQHPPETIPTMLEAAEGGADLVVGCRYMPGGSRGGLDGRVRRLVSRGATILARLLFAEARRSHDPLSGFFLCRRELVDGVEFRPVGFKVLLELLVLLGDVEVKDVPLRFDARELGSSKATVKQGIQYLRHIRSLVLDVQGSARLWKFGLVGASGLVVFLPVLALLTGVAHLDPFLAFLPAFAISIAWNTALNTLWTFADLRRQHGAARRGYLSTALGAGMVMFGCYAVLVGLGWRPVAAGALSTLVAAGLNGLANLPRVRRPPRTWWRLAADSGMQAGLEQVREQLGAGRAYVVPADLRGESARLSAELVARVVRERQAVMATEAASYRPQRRTNIAVESVIVVPVVRDDVVVAAVVLERSAPRGFDQNDLEAAVHAVLGLGDALHAGGDVATGAQRRPAHPPAAPSPATAVGGVGMDPSASEGGR